MILVTRHGETDWNVEGKIQGVTDVELNEKGISQAKEIRDALEKEKIDVIISSSLKRALKTAEIINEKQDCPIVVEDGIKERCFGELEGLTREDFKFSNLWDYDLNISDYGAESIKSLFERTSRTMEKIEKNYPNKNVLVVTHGATYRGIYCYFNGLPKDLNDINKISIKNCEIVRF